MSARRERGRVWLAAVLVLSGAGAGADRAGGREARPSVRSLEEIRRSVAGARGRLRSLWVEYRTRTDTPGFGADMHVITAAKGPSRLLAQEHRFGGANATDPKAHRVFLDAAPGATPSWNVYYPHPNRYEVSRKLLTPRNTTQVRASTFLVCLGWWPPDDDSAPPDLAGRSFFLHDALKAPGCRVRAVQEWVDGRWCHVVEVPGRDRLWIDAGEGLLVRRELLDAAPPHPPVVTVRLGDYREVAPGVKIPFRVVHGIKGADVTLDVLRCRANDVSDDVFRYRPEPGTLVVDRDTDTYHQVPGGLGYLDTVVAIAREALPARAPRRASWALPAVWAGGGLIAGFGLYGLGRWALGRARRGRAAGGRYGSQTRHHCPA